MRRLLFSIGLIILTMAMSHTPQAGVTGPCSDCHTMHNSQGGLPMAYGLKSDLSDFEPDATPNPTLLITDCVGCHAKIGSATIDDGVPIVFNTSTPSNPLAGGNFYYIETNGDAYGHNVAAIDEEGTAAMFPPPGDQVSTGITKTNFSCAGKYGCHGDRSKDDELDAIKTAHHTDDSAGIDVSSVGLSYRFLDGIKGIEDEDGDWEQDNQQDPPTGNHNWYKGATILDDFADDTTISYLCGQCHGNTGGGGFHNSDGVGSSSPWLRHPTDILLPTTGEYAGYTTYSVVAPVAYTNPATHERSDAVVMCLSCHRAHGSPYFKIMRWNYRDWPGTIAPTGSKGCGTCHTSKSGATDEWYAKSAHGSTTYGVNRTRTADYVQGNCAHCHEQHASIEGEIPPDAPYDYELFYGVTSACDLTCYKCHKGSSADEQEVFNYPYGVLFGGFSLFYYESIYLQFCANTSARAKCGSRHFLWRIYNILKNDGYGWGFPDNFDPCSACHNPHLAQQNYPISIVDEKLKTAISRPSSHNELWGDDTNERMSTYASSVGGTYQAPYYGDISGTKYEPSGNASPSDGSNLPDYVTFCMDCHQYEQWDPQRAATVIAIDWSQERHGGYPSNDDCVPHFDEGSTRPPYTNPDSNYVLSCLDCHEPHGTKKRLHLIRRFINGEVVPALSPCPEEEEDWAPVCQRCHTFPVGVSHFEWGSCNHGDCHGHPEDEGNLSKFHGGTWKSGLCDGKPMF